MVPMPGGSTSITTVPEAAPVRTASRPRGCRRSISVSRSGSSVAAWNPWQHRQVHSSICAGVACPALQGSQFATGVFDGDSTNTCQVRVM